MPKQPKQKKPPARRRRFRRRLIALAVVLSLVGGFIALSLTILFPATRVVVVGQTRYSAQQFTEVLQLEQLQPNLFLADTQALVERAEGALPYANIVRVTRQLPNALRFHVEDHAPVFAQYQDELWWLIADNGRLLEQTETPPEAGILMLRGTDLLDPEPGRNAQWERGLTRPGDLHSLFDALHESSLWPDVTGVRISGYAIPDVIYQDRIRIRFGSPAQEDDLSDKLRQAEQVITRLNEQNPNYRGMLDLGVAGQIPFTPMWGNEWQP